MRGDVAEAGIGRGSVELVAQRVLSEATPVVGEQEVGRLAGAGGAAAAGPGSGA